MDARDRRHVALDRSGLPAGLHAIFDERVDGLRIRRQIRHASRFAKCLKDRAIGLLCTDRIGRVGALRHCLPLE
jgi:hypothetical protein